MLYSLMCECVFVLRTGWKENESETYIDALEHKI